MSVCGRCGAVFTCGMADAAGDAPCWCTALPALPASAYVTKVTKDGDRRAATCFCPACLGLLLKTQQQADGAAPPAPQSQARCP